MAETGSELVSSFVIEERTGDKRRLTLRTRALPYRPFELSGTQRNSIDWYPGSPIGTLQVYGAKEEPTTISGQWKDTFVGGIDFANAPAIVTSDGTAEVLDSARAIVQLVDDMRRKGQEIEVTWLDQIRRGIIERFTVRWSTGHDCEWEIGFAWISQGESLNDVGLVDSGNDLGDLPNQLQTEIDLLNSVAGESVAANAITGGGVGAADLPQSGERFAGISGDLGAVAANIQEFTDALTDAVVSAGSVISSPNEAVRRVAGILDGIKLEAEELIRIAEDVADGALLDTGAFNVTTVVKSTFGELLATRGHIRAKANAATAIRNLAAREQVALMNRISSTVISVFQARESQDLRQVSQQFYGTPDEWRSLMVYNHLLSSGLIAGQVVFVPAISPGDAC